MAKKKGRRYPAPTGERYGGGRSGTGTDLDEEDLAVLGYFQGQQRQQQDPRIDLAMKLFDIAQGQETATADRAFKERQQQATELYNKGMLEVNQAQEARLVKNAADAAIAEDVKEGTRQRELSEAVGREKEKEKLGLSEKEKDRVAAAKKEAVSNIDTMVERGIINKDEARKRYEQLDPALAEIAKGIKTQADEAAFKRNLPAYQALSPKDKARALPEAFGGAETFQRIKDAAEGYTYAPGSPSAMPGKMVDWKPQLEPAVSEPPMKVGYGGPAVENAPAYSYTTRAPQTAAPQTVPAVAGMTEPTFAYEEGYPSAQPNYSVQTPAPSFIDSVMAKLEDARQREAMEPKREWYPDLGTAALPPGTLPPELLREPTTRPLGY